MIALPKTQSNQARESESKGTRVRVGGWGGGEEATIVKTVNALSLAVVRAIADRVECQISFAVARVDPNSTLRAAVSRIGGR